MVRETEESIAYCQLDVMTIMILEYYDQQTLLRGKVVQVKLIGEVVKFEGLQVEIKFIYTAYIDVHVGPVVSDCEREWKKEQLHAFA